MEGLRLPRRVEEEPAAAQLAAELAARAQLLWAGARLRVPQAELGTTLADALTSAFSAGQIVRGLEEARRVLAAEDRGLAHVDRSSGTVRGQRISRLLVLADDGAERFYRSVESLLRRHAPRLLALRLCVDEGALGRLLFGPDQQARLLLVEHKDAVAAVLLALQAQWSEDDGPAS